MSGAYDIRLRQSDAAIVWRIFNSEVSAKVEGRAVNIYGDPAIGAEVRLRPSDTSPNPLLIRIIPRVISSPIHSVFSFSIPCLPGLTL